MADNQSNKVLKKNNLRLGIEFFVFKTPTISFPQNLPHQAMVDDHQNMTILVTTKLTLPQQAKSSITDFGIT